MPAASAARAMNPKWRLFAKLCTCSTQIPVKLATSESVTLFRLDFTVTMARLLCPAPNLLHAYLDAVPIVGAALFLSNSGSVLQRVRWVQHLSKGGEVWGRSRGAGPWFP